MYSDPHSPPPAPSPTHSSRLVIKNPPQWTPKEWADIQATAASLRQWDAEGRPEDLDKNGKTKSPGAPVKYFGRTAEWLERLVSTGSKDIDFRWRCNWGYGFDANAAWRVGVVIAYTRDTYWLCVESERIHKGKKVKDIRSLPSPTRRDDVLSALKLLAPAGVIGVMRWNVCSTAFNFGIPWRLSQKYGETGPRVVFMYSAEDDEVCIGVASRPTSRAAIGGAQLMGVSGLTKEDALARLSGFRKGKGYPVTEKLLAKVARLSSAHVRKLIKTQREATE